MSINQNSTIEEVHKANLVNPYYIQDSIEMWEYLQLYTGDAADPCYDFSNSTSCSGKDYFKIGLFAQDLTNFIFDCYRADSCNLVDYVGIDGWAIGMVGGVSSATKYQ